MAGRERRAAACASNTAAVADREWIRDYLIKLLLPNA
jgi:hypothetical protein